MYPCFISYVQPQDEWVRRTTERALNVLKNALAYYTKIPPYIDVERLKPGYNHNDRIAEAICQSACMVVLYYPPYLDSPYCRRELVAMKYVEQKRRALAPQAVWGHSMFVPFVIRGKASWLPQFAYQNALWFDYTDQALADHDISRKGTTVKGKLLNLAESIWELHTALQKTCTGEDCKAFHLPSEREADLELGFIAPPVDSFPGRP